MICEHLQVPESATGLSTEEFTGGERGHGGVDVGIARARRPVSINQVDIRKTKSPLNRYIEGPLPSRSIYTSLNARPICYSRLFASLPSSTHSLLWYVQCCTVASVFGGFVLAGGYPPPEKSPSLALALGVENERDNEPGQGASAMAARGK